MSLTVWEEGEVSNEVEARWPGLPLPVAKYAFRFTCAALEAERRSLAIAEENLNEIIQFDLDNERFALDNEGWPAA